MAEMMLETRLRKSRKKRLVEQSLYKNNEIPKTDIDAKLGTVTNHDINEQELETICQSAANECFISFIQSAVSLLEAPSEDIDHLKNETKLQANVAINQIEETTDEQSKSETCKSNSKTDQSQSEEANFEEVKENSCNITDEKDSLEDVLADERLGCETQSECTSETIKAAIDEILMRSVGNPDAIDVHEDEQLNYMSPDHVNENVCQVFNKMEGRIAQENSPIMESNQECMQVQAPLLKPSVFVTPSDLYNSSFQTTPYSWDRTKYNLVLLPDLSKIVYPDPDIDPDILYSHPARTVDRSNKPIKFKGNKSLDYKGQRKLVTIKEDLDAVEDKRNLEVDLCRSDQKTRNPSPTPSEISVDNEDFRIFFHSLTQSAKDDSQTVIFQVGPLYYKETFEHCSTSDTFKAVRARAEELSQNQLVLANKCLLASVSELFQVHNGTLVIYEDPQSLDLPSKEIRIHFGANEGFYHESFYDCEDYYDLMCKARRRAEWIIRNQNLLKATVKNTSVDADSKPTELDGENMEANDSDGYRMPRGLICPGPNFLLEKDDYSALQIAETIQTAKHPAEKPTKTSRPRTMRSTWNSLRNWIKNRKSKQPQPTASEYEPTEQRSSATMHEK